MTRRRTAFIIACAVFATLGSVRAAEEHGVALQINVPVKMRDGVTLYADVYRPKDDGKYPVLLQRTPYNKDGDREFGLRAAARGYVVIIQDVRGRYTSEGEWYTFKHEPDDGYDTVEWAGTLPYSDGKVGMFGGSYVGATQMLAAIAHPPHLAGICPIVTASNYHSNWTYQGGAFAQWFNQSWTSGLAQDTIARNTRGRSNALKGMAELPLGSFPLFNPPADGRPPEATSTLAQYYLDWIAHPNEDGYWKQWSIEGHFSDITVPALHIVAWYDLFQDGSFRNYIGIKAHGANEAARNGQRLITIVGGHAGNGPIIGDVDFGPDSKFDEDGATLDWYDYLFKGVRNQFAGKPVKLFVMGANQWRDEDDWPLARARNTKYFLHSDGKANSLRGSGTLSTTAPAAETPDQYVFDPANPVPTIGGPLCCDGSHLKPGPRDQRPVEARDDVLVYSTPPLAADMEVTGPVTLELYVKSSAVDTDFTAKLLDVRPDGFAQNMTEGILRARYRDSQEKPSLITPGQVYKLTVDVWSTSNVFKKGHALRLEVSSSNFPRFDRNLNTGEDNGTGTRFVTATNSVLHDAQHPSALVLPVIGQN
jgi:putative CocE/NonD family hydrolase